jgi:hypothetical protein
MFEKECKELDRLDLDGLARDEKRNEIYARIRDIAHGSRPDFVRFLGALDLGSPDDALHLMYVVEALSTAAEDWIAELTIIFERALEAAEKNPAARWPAGVLFSFAFLEQAPRRVQDAFLPRYLRLARSESVSARKAAVDLFGGFRVATTVGIREILISLLDDPDWQVRRDAEALLADESLLPAGYRPRMLDRVRRALKK